MTHSESSTSGRVNGHDWRIALATLCLTASCSSARAPEGVPRPEEAWVAATCVPASPDTTGWKVYRLSDVELTVPADFTPRNRTSRSIEFVHLGSVLAIMVSTSATRDLFYPQGRPLLAHQEAGCASNIGGYSGVIKATARANTFSVYAEWDGADLWGPSDWRKRLIASITTSRLGDAQRLRDALHTIRAVRDSSSY